MEQFEMFDVPDTSGPLVPALLLERMEYDPEKGELFLDGKKLPVYESNFVDSRRGAYSQVCRTVIGENHRYWHASRVIGQIRGHDLVGKVVHHVNQDPFDNRVENLRLLSRSDHVKLHNYHCRYVWWSLRGALKRALDCWSRYRRLEAASKRL